MTTTTSTQEPRKSDEPAPAPDAQPTPAPDAQPTPRQIIGRFRDGPSSVPGAASAANLEQNRELSDGRPRPSIALFCFDSPDGYIGGHVGRMASALAARGRDVHLYCRSPFVLDQPRVQVHPVEVPEEGDLIEQAREFTSRAGNAFMQQFSGSSSVEVLAYEWTAAGVVPLLRGLRNQQSVLSLHSLERQRSDVTSELARKISEVERESVEAARTVLVHDQATAEVARLWIPSCVDRLVSARTPFPLDSFDSELDPGMVKARYQVGPVDPVLLFVGDLDDPYGPDLILKAMPAILRHHPQARLVLVGDGHLFWPLRVYSRYLLLEHAIRLVGHLQDQPLNELVQASDIVVVPSRQSTPWWPILASWAARRPLVATHDAAPNLLEHEKDSVLVYPSENSIVWGVERVLYDAALGKAIGAAGREKVEDRFGWNALAEQVEEVLAASVAR